MWEFFFSNLLDQLSYKLGQCSDKSHLRCHRHLHNVFNFENIRFFLSMSITFKNAISNASFMVFSSQERCTRITVKGNTLLNRKGFKIYKIIHAGICSENQDIKNRLCLNKINYFVQFYGNAGLQWNHIWILTGSNLMAVSGEKFRKITYFANYCFFFYKSNHWVRKMKYVQTNKRLLLGFHLSWNSELLLNAISKIFQSHRFELNDLWFKTPIENSDCLKSYDCS